MKKFIGPLCFSIVLVLAFAFVGFGAERSAVRKYENAKRIAEEKLEKLSNALEQLPPLPSDSSDMDAYGDAYRPEIDRLNRLMKDFETAFIGVVALVPEEYVWDHDQWHKKILKRLEAMGFR